MRKKKASRFMVVQATIFILGLLLGAANHTEILAPFDQLLVAIDHQSQLKATNSIANVPNSKISLCFTPQSKCGILVVNEITHATDNIYMQAYGLTHPKIVDALI